MPGCWPLSSRRSRSCRPDRPRPRSRRCPHARRPSRSSWRACRPALASAACSSGSGTLSCRGRAARSSSPTRRAAVKTFRERAPWRAASEYRTAGEAFRAGRETAVDLRDARVHATFAPVLDLAYGPLGSRHFARPELGVAFARGLGRAACQALPWPRLDAALDGRGARLRRAPRARPGSLPSRGPGRRLVRDGRPRDLPAARLRAAPRSSRPPTGCCAGSASRALRSRIRSASSAARMRRTGRDWRCGAGADLVLTTSSRDATRMVDALVPLARAGELDEHVVRILRYRRSLGAAPAR